MFINSPNEQNIVILSGCSNFIVLCKTPNTGLSTTGKTRESKFELKTFSFKLAIENFVKKKLPVPNAC